MEDPNNENRTEKLISEIRGINKETLFACPIPESYIVQGFAALGEAAIPAILKEIKYSDAKRRGILLIALAETRSPKAIPMLLRSTRDRDESNCRLAAELLKGVSPRGWKDIDMLEDAIRHTKSREAYTMLKGLRPVWNDAFYAKKARSRFAKPHRMPMRRERGTQMAKAAV